MIFFQFNTSSVPNIEILPIFHNSRWLPPSKNIFEKIFRFFRLQSNAKFSSPAPNSLEKFPPFILRLSCEFWLHVCLFFVTGTIWAVCTSDDLSDLHPGQSERWSAPWTICTQNDWSDLHPGQSKWSAPGTIRTICTWGDPNDLHPSWSKRSSPRTIQLIWKIWNSICPKHLKIMFGNIGSKILEDINNKRSFRDYLKFIPGEDRVFS